MWHGYWGATKGLSQGHQPRREPNPTAGTEIRIHTAIVSHQEVTAPKQIPQAPQRAWLCDLEVTVLPGHPRKNRERESGGLTTGAARKDSSAHGC